MSANFCQQCGSGIAPDAKFCPNCGQVIQAPSAPPQNTTGPQTQRAMVSEGKGIAVVSLVLAIVACIAVIPPIGILLAVIAVGTGIYAKRKLSANGQSTGIAIGGIVIGSIGAVFYACFLVVALVVAFSASNQQLNQAKWNQANDTLKQVEGGITEYFLRHGNYPEFNSWEAMVASSSPLVQRSMIRPGLPVNDPWGNPYEGKSTKSGFELKCAVPPDKGELIIWRVGVVPSQ